MGANPNSVTAADVNGDGRVDLISANLAANTLSVLTNHGGGGFALASSPGVGVNPSSVTAADVNDDGQVDLISASLSASTLSVLFNLPEYKGRFSGDGSALAGLNASPLTTGTVPDARLSANVTKLGSSIESSEISDATITAADLAVGAVTSAGIANGTIAATDLSASLASGLWSANAGGVNRASGNVGIGTTSPDQARLVVNGTAGTDTVGNHASYVETGQIIVATAGPYTFTDVSATQELARRLKNLEAREVRLAALEEEIAALKRLVVQLAGAQSTERSTARNSTDVPVPGFDAAVSIAGVERSPVRTLPSPTSRLAPAEPR